MIAEYCLKKMMGPNSNLTIFSAGIRGKPAVIDPYLLNELLKIGIDASAHKITPITKEILIKSDLIVAMSNDHKEALLTNLGIIAPTFNEICFNISAPMPDIDTVTDVENRRNEIEQFEKETMAYIYLSMPKFIINMDKFLK
jgi:protein-tyrosine-phosphatase